MNDTIKFVMGRVGGEMAQRLLDAVRELRNLNEWVESDPDCEYDVPQAMWLEAEANTILANAGLSFDWLNRLVAN